MPPFENPRPPFRLSQLREWHKNVEPPMRNLLWGDYWQRFNTIQISILRESDYFNDAIEIAKLAKGQKVEFERIFTERNKKRQEKFLSQLTRAANQTIYQQNIFPCADARDTVFEVCRTGCLLDFLRLLNGTAHGWEADAADVQLDDATSNLSKEKPQAPIDMGIPGTYDEKILGSDDDFETQWPDDDYYFEETPIERQIREEQSASATYYIGTFTTYSPHVPASDISVLEKENKEKMASTIRGNRKRNRSDDDDARGHNREPKSTAPSSIPQASIQEAIDRSATDDISTLDDNSDGHVYKRRKLELEPTSISTSSQLPTDRGNKKRLIYHECNDHERGHKRQRLEGTAAYTPFHTSSSTQQLLDEKVAAKKSRSKDNGRYRCGSRKGKKPFLKISRSPEPAKNTRSLRSTGQSEFWELDQASKSRSI
ncbi:hypothetical protein V8C35DRAFT_308611 [Trichoderma chlorosporum]